MKKAIIVSSAKKPSKKASITRAPRTVCTTMFTAVKKLTVGLSGGIYTAFATLTIVDFNDFDSFIGVFRYYTLKTMSAQFTMPTAAQNGTVALIRPITQLQDTSFVIAQTGYSKLVEDPDAIILIQTSKNPTRIINYSDKRLKQQCDATTDKVGAYYVVDPNASSAQTVQLTVRILVTFYDRAAE